MFFLDLKKTVHVTETRGVNIDLLPIESRNMLMTSVDEQSCFNLSELYSSFFMGATLCNTQVFLMSIYELFVGQQVSMKKAISLV